jgi:hypothetical protein
MSLARFMVAVPFLAPSFEISPDYMLYDPCLLHLAGRSNLGIRVIGGTTYWGWFQPSKSYDFVPTSGLHQNFINEKYIRTSIVD